MRRRAFPALVLVILLSGCAGLGPRSSAEPVDERVEVEAMLVYIDRLATAEREELARMGAQLPESTSGERSLEQRLRYGLWRATPGHARFDLASARSALEKVLIDAGPRLGKPTRALVRLQLRHLRQLDQLRQSNTNLTQENRQLRNKIRQLTDLERRMGSPER